MKIARLKFKSGLHLGADRGGIGKENVQEIAHSDTIFSMLVNAFADLVSGDKEEIDNFIDSIKALSSGFLFERRKYGLEYFLPRPMTDPPNFFGKYGKKRKLEYHKAIKRCAYIDRLNFIKWTSGQSIELEKIESHDYQNLFHMIVRPQHARDRLTQASALYHSGEMFFSPNAGLYFLIDGVEDKLLVSILRHAGINGLGGRRSLGAGIFESEIDSIDSQWNEIFKQAGDRFVLISTYHPSDLELNEISPIAYSLIVRKGWIFSSGASGQFKRQTCWMFDEGSVFSTKPEGLLVDVTPDVFKTHPIFRYGKAMAIPCKVPGDEK